MIQIHPAVLTLIASILIAVIGYLVSLFIKGVLGTQKELAKSIEKLNLSLTRLNGTIISMQSMNEIFEAGCKERHARIDKALKELEEKVE